MKTLYVEHLAKRIAVALAFTAISVSGAQAQLSVDSETKPVVKKTAPTVEPFSVREAAWTPRVDISLPPPDLTQVREEDEARPENRARRIGIRRGLPAPVEVLSRQSSHGMWVYTEDGGSLWTLTIRSAQAEAIRIHLEALQLPFGARLMVFNTESPEEAYGPYDRSDVRESTDLWTASVFASTVTLECYVPPGVEAEKVSLKVREIAHVYEQLSDLMVPKEGNCHNDVTCFASWANEANGVAGMGTIGTAGVLWCTGSLINDFDTDTFEDYFLTGNHCLGSPTTLATQADANTLEFYWFFQTATCNGTPPNPATVPRTGGGADLISAQTSTAGNDHCFLRIRNETPGGVTYVGWTTGSPGSSDSLTSIHHPDGAFKRISFGGLDGSNTNYWQIEWTSGVTEGGSSGSPLFDPNKRLIGQLYGGFSSCANPTGIDSYGRFNVTYPHIQRWIEIGGTIHVDGTYSGTELGTPTQPFNTVGEANNFSWDGARISVQAGSYPEAVVFTNELTIMASGGTAVIGQ